MTIAAPATGSFRACVRAAAEDVVRRASRSFGSREALAAQFPFIEEYDEHAPLPMDEPACGPLERVRVAAELSSEAIELWLAIGLVEEDARFGLLFESVHETAGQHRPTVSLLNEWWRDDYGSMVRAALRSLLHCGLVEPVNPSAPRMEWALQAVPVLWDTLRGDPLASEEFTHKRPEEFPRWDDLALPESVANRRRQLEAIAASDRGALLVRGPHRNGRGTLLGALARSAGKGLLAFHTGSKDDARLWRLAGPLAAMLDAIPVARVEASAGDSLEVPALRAYRGAMGLVTGRFGVVHGAACEPLATVHLPMPSLAIRERFWPPQAAGRIRITTGNLQRASRIAELYAHADGRAAPNEHDLRLAASTLNRQTLDTLAVRLEPSGGWSRIAVEPDTHEELRNLESRCRHRERLPQGLGVAFRDSATAAVRVLLKGPSGCGKTHAAGLLASVLGKEIYRLDLSSVVNKYIGETEKNLERLFSLSEELDVILLLDEGDALLTQRTAVTSSNDRYANLETNFLLQRIEAFDGILIVTTNAGERIDPAFQRRMDVVINFQPPGAAERHAIWQLHLPHPHGVDPLFLSNVASRCALSGGQIRNAVLHASLLALECGPQIEARHVEAAVRREYRKAGADCPLRR